MAGRRYVRRQKAPQHVRVLDGKVVIPVKCVSTQAGNKWNMMGGSIDRNGESIKDSSGRPLPFRSIGELVWR